MTIYAKIRRKFGLSQFASICKLTQYPSCCGIKVMHQLHFQYLNGDKLVEAIEMIEDYVKKDNYTVITAATVNNQKRIRDALEKREWKVTQKFRSIRTDSEIWVHQKLLDPTKAL